MSETPMLAKSKTPRLGGQSGKHITGATQHQMLSCSGSQPLTHEAQMVSRVREKGVLLTQAMPYFSKYHMPSRHSGPDPISVRLCSTGDLAPPADSKLHLC